MTTRLPALFALGLVCLSGSATLAAEANPFAGIGHFVVIYTENRSFDGLYGHFPGADGIPAEGAGPAALVPQVDRDGTVLPHLPATWEKAKADPRFPADLPNAPFEIGRFVPAGERTPDLVHRFYEEQEQINGGRNDRFVEVSDAGGLAMGFYAEGVPQMQALAKAFTLADHFHHGAFGGSFLNHIHLICACAPVFPNAPANLVADVDPATGKLVRAANSPASALQGPPVWSRNGSVTPDGFAVNTLQPTYMPYHAKSKPEERLPPQTMATIGDRLSAHKISWAWYGAGWAEAEAGRLPAYEQPEMFMPHHQPFNYFAAFAPGTPARRDHLKDGAEFEAAVRQGTLPAVAFYKPLGRDNLHPGYTDPATGDAQLTALVKLIQQSPNWHDTAIIITSDENGGTWDHVAPPKGDRFGPGVRVPTLIISPLARKGFVDHTVYDTTSILRTLEVRFGLEPLTARDASVADLRNAFVVK